ncbi:hypothetical protein HYV64_02405 [Candidatus Shapirobacteria bacterium]|nr:hypothetical protein [Candidatus Shapirobacteria bacterium]
MKFNLRLLYLYLFSFVGLLIVVFGGIQIVNLGLKTWVFRDADGFVFYGPTPAKTDPEYVDPEAMKAQQEQQTKNLRQSELANSLAMISVGLPLYLYHWKTIQKEAK